MVDYGKWICLTVFALAVFYTPPAFAGEWPKDVTIGATTLKGLFDPIAAGWGQQLKKHSKVAAEYTDMKQTTRNALIPFHPGAVRYYKEKGIWTPQLEQKQQALLKQVSQ